MRHNQPQYGKKKLFPLKKKSKLSEKAQYYACKCHTAANHKYDGMNYGVHLANVICVANDFLHLIPESQHEMVLAACWCHDLIEDARQTYNDVKDIIGIEAADIVYALTNEKGKTRKDRANEKYYLGIYTTPFAPFVKMCDRIANVAYSKEVNSRMIDMYRKENDYFLSSMFKYGDCGLQEMVDYLKTIIEKEEAD